MGALPGDEKVAAYLGRLAQEAALVLTEVERRNLIDDVERRINGRAGGPPRRDLPAVERVLLSLGDPKALVGAAMARRSSTSIPRGAPLRPAAAAAGSNDTAELGRSWSPSDAQDTDPNLPRVRVASSRTPNKASGRSGPLPPSLRVRPTRAEEERGPDLLNDLSRLRWEVLALAVLVAAPFLIGVFGFLLGVVLVARSGLWDLTDKVRALLGLPALAVVVAVLWAWIEATQMQESESSRTRLAAAARSLGESWAALPALSGCLAALYLAFVLVRDQRTGR